MGKLEGRVALVTASGRNIGRATALRFAADGADLIVNDLPGEAVAEQVADEIRALGRRALAISADVADRAQVDAMVARGLDELGRIDILVNTAGIRPKKPFLELTTADWDRVRGVILDGALYCTQAVLPSMVERGFGRIVFFVGDGAWAGSPRRAHVSAAKMGLVGLCRALASEFAPHGIRLNAISPGRVDTNRTAAWTQASRLGVEDIPMGRLGQVDDIAAACLFLVSEDSGYITGQTLHVNGGSAYF
jgi:3-oxoacyl-[acyl-carrier protein] reductase